MLYQTLKSYGIWFIESGIRLFCDWWARVRIRTRVLDKQTLKNIQRLKLEKTGRPTWNRASRQREGGCGRSGWFRHRTASHQSAVPCTQSTSIRYLLFRVVDLNRIGPDPNHFVGSGSVPSTCVFYFFREDFTLLPKILKILTHLPLITKEKHCKLTLLWIKIIKCCPIF